MAETTGSVHESLIRPERMRIAGIMVPRLMFLHRVQMPLLPEPWRRP